MFNVYCCVMLGLIYQTLFYHEARYAHSETDHISKGDNYICTFIFSQRAPLCIIPVYKLCDKKE